jgi:hypothetical protein
VLGWCADFFRFWWGLVYWNTRKTWFQIRRGRSACPCQTPSDSGRAYETGCDACASWHKQKRFKRVCPLLVETPHGLRCSANTSHVRPFWLRAFGYFGGSALIVYGIGAISFFIFLRTIGYPVSIVHVALPPLWHRVGQARGWFFHERSNRAFAEGKTAEGLLYLDNAFQFDPTNYAAGLSLAKHYQVGQPARSDEVFERLLHEHPDKQHATAQDWFRALLARGSFQKIAVLARDELLTDAAHAPVWVRAVIFATQQTKSTQVLRELATSEAPAAKIWRQVFETELLLSDGRIAETRAALVGPWRTEAKTQFTLFYRVQTLIALGETFEAIDLVQKFPGMLDAEATITLLLEAYAAHGAQGPLHHEIDKLLAPRFTAQNLSIIKIVCAQVIRYPDAAVFDQLWRKVEREQVPLSTETAGAWFSLLCAAGAVGDQPRLHELTARLKQASTTPFLALNIVEAFFRGESNERRITTFLPILPLPIEVTYALLQRYGQSGPPSAVAAKRA